MPNNPPRAKSKSNRTPKNIKGDYIKTYAWQRVRACYMEKYPICQRCIYMDNVTVTSTYKLSVHHIRLRTKYQHLQDDENNLLTLCSPCHSYLSSLENNGQEHLAIQEGETIKAHFTSN